MLYGVGGAVVITALIAMTLCCIFARRNKRNAGRLEPFHQKVSKVCENGLITASNLREDSYHSFLTLNIVHLFLPGKYA